MKNAGGIKQTLSLLKKSKEKLPLLILPWSLYQRSAPPITPPENEGLEKFNRYF